MRHRAMIFSLCACVLAILAGCATTADRAAPEPEGKTAVIDRARAGLRIDAPAARKAAAPLFLTHYMPWFQAPPVSAGFGWHWHMGSTDPFQKDAMGLRGIASTNYPLTGPYDSRDPAVLEYQTMLMKLSGIDGVIVDWYGTSTSFDFPDLHKASQALFAAVKKAGLAFAVCYEDASIGRRVESREIGAEAAVDAGKADIRWAVENWFSDRSYLKIEGRPVVLCFGPQYFKEAGQWNTIFSGIEPRPLFFTLDGAVPGAADGSYPWPPMWASGGGTLSPERLVGYLNEFYAKNASSPFLVSSAFPGFHDYYKQARVRESYGYLDDYIGETFQLTLDAALAARSNVVQIATWNDYSEGTMIEPTVQNGYRDLETLQDAKRRVDSTFPYGRKDLRIPLEVFSRRIKSPTTADTAGLDRLFAAVARGDAAAYRATTTELGFDSAMTAGWAPVQRDIESAAVVPAAVKAAPTSGAAAASGSPASPDTYAGLKNLALGARASSNNHIYEFTADKATDGETRTYWEGAAKSYPNELTVDLGAARAIRAVRLKLNPQRIWGARVQRFAVLTSVDGGTFTEAVVPAGYTFDPVSNANTVTLPLSASARFVRLSFTANDGATAGQAAEMEVLGE